MYVCSAQSTPLLLELSSFSFPFRACGSSRAEMVTHRHIDTYTRIHTHTHTHTQFSIVNHYHDTDTDTDRDRDRERERERTKV